jgi:acyl carrier protein
MQAISETVLTIIKDVCPPSVPEIADLDKKLLDYGLDSLDFSAVLLALEEKYGITIPDKDMESLETVNQITAYVEESIS